MKAERKVNRYQLWTYDVWGNKKDGFDVNNRFKEGIVEIPEDATNREFLKIVRKAISIKRGYHHADFDIDGEPEYTLYVTYTGTSLGGWYPVCEMEYINDNLTENGDLKSLNREVSIIGNGN